MPSLWSDEHDPRDEDLHELERQMQDEYDDYDDDYYDDYDDEYYDEDLHDDPWV